MREFTRLTVLSLLLITFAACGGGNLLLKGELDPVSGYGPLETFMVKAPGVYRVDLNAVTPNPVITITPPFGRGYVWDGVREGRFSYEAFFPLPGLAALRLRNGGHDGSYEVRIVKVEAERLAVGEFGELRFTQQEGAFNKFCWYEVEVTEPGSYRLRLEADRILMVSLEGADNIVSWRSRNGKISFGEGEISRPGLYAIEAVISSGEEVNGKVGLFRVEE